MTLESSILNNIHKLPEPIQQSVLLYTEFLVSRYAKDSAMTAEDAAIQNSRLAGSMKGTFVLPLPNNFDEPLEEFEEYM
ncbi:DUF2281 domain-containing protein [Nodosilinea sp. LEGE 07088]|uniref:type II toxin-antitoxin system VapB family antitoxin n=1 Tax=Nodosilinea sp. LEGE 07088 TaxID=2777968 RepID=UPI0018819E05|nr:DUF2281 domain-containing protein [Nodosilinea sp. LEGE 07088]MBE9140237.1 DUF2281 domain-containing protein [Nodosilinea sp. LEGE 07088]